MTEFHAADLAHYEYEGQRVPTVLYGCSKLDKATIIVSKGSKGLTHMVYLSLDDGGSDEVVEEVGSHMSHHGHLRTVYMSGFRCYNDQDHGAGILEMHLSVSTSYVSADLQFDLVVGLVRQFFYDLLVRQCVLVYDLWYCFTKLIHMLSMSTTPSLPFIIKFPRRGWWRKSSQNQNSYKIHKIHIEIPMNKGVLPATSFLPATYCSWSMLPSSSRPGQTFSRIITMGNIPNIALPSELLLGLHILRMLTCDPRHHRLVALAGVARCSGGVGRRGTVPGRSLLCCHAMIGDIFRYIAGEDEEEHADELPDKEPAFLPVERPHHAPACTVLPPQVAPGGPAPVRALMRSFNQQNGGRRR
ncbi:hypothetical protein TRIUR3_06169 [Triticum urartu]|uniref:Uncharacterized protein n=1 Tax=Triticum urartu TaxID=4572 RepID=M7ZK95_TRIUA|nr:hypothetical protein TRIUR3_06169 [Triticum urartu]